MMIDPPGYREAIDAIDAATPEERQKLAALQQHADEMKATFDRIVRTVEPGPEEMRNTLLANLRVHTRTNMGILGLTWMQRLPGAWLGWYPENCQKVAEMIGAGEAV